VTLRRRIAIRIVLVLVVVGVGFALFQHPYRLFEVWLSGGLLHSLGVPNVVSTQGTGILVHHAGTDQYILLDVAPQCSSLPAVLAIFALALPMHSIAGPRIYLGALFASVVALVGNIVRIDAVLGVGVFFGFISLVFFHTWVASIFDFAAVLFGWILLIRMQLPKGGGGGRARLELAGALAGGGARMGAADAPGQVGPGPRGADSGLGNGAAVGMPSTPSGRRLVEQDEPDG
jgi:hypothetical protein